MHKTDEEFTMLVQTRCPHLDEDVTEPGVLIRYDKLCHLQLTVPQARQYLLDATTLAARFDFMVSMTKQAHELGIPAAETNHLIRKVLSCVPDPEHDKLGMLILRPRYADGEVWIMVRLPGWDNSLSWSVSDLVRHATAVHRIALQALLESSYYTVMINNVEVPETRADQLLSHLKTYSDHFAGLSLGNPDEQLETNPDV